MGKAEITNRRLSMLTLLTGCCLITGTVSSSMAKEAESSGKNLLFSDVAAPAKIENPPKDDLLEVDSIIPASSSDPVDLQADRVEYDQGLGVVSAIGNVELVQLGRILRAEQVTYSIKEDKVQATGNVVLNEVTGETYFSESVELKDRMKDGFVTQLQGILTDGSRFSAEEAEKIGDRKVVMHKASYTACEPCKADPSKAPIWQIKAREVVHHKDEQRVSYDDATFEVAGVPVVYTPYFSHSDGTIKRKSGFLTPRVGFDSQLGAIYDQSYYWDIAPDKDATIGTMLMTEAAPLVKGEYRQRFENAEIKLQGGITNSDRVDRDNGNDVKQGRQNRGHIIADALWNINDKWRAGAGVETVSDSQYLRQYNISNEDVLENKVYLERFNKRDYATAKIVRFKDIRVSDRKVDQPNLLPEIYSRFLGNPNALLGGRWDVEVSALGLHREGDDQDMGRSSLKAGWKKRYITNFGLVNTFETMLRGDAYHVLDRAVAQSDPTRNDEGSALRGFANANLQVGYPLEKRMDNAQMVLEPLAAITAGTNLNDNNNIPNEDSQDVFLDATNIFNSNRFPGYDRIEDKSHATYGLRTGLYADNGYQGELFFGQSYRLDDDNTTNPFPNGSGLSEQESDFVGNVSARMGDTLQLNYALQLDNDTLYSRRHEVDASGQIGRFQLGARYFYANSLQGTDFDESREQIQNFVHFRFTDDWSILTSTQYDLADETEGLRRILYGLDYEGQCVTFMVTGERKLTRDSSGDSGTQIMMRIGLKNLGEFETSGLSVGTE
ncbi:MAG TPA: LPS assembly protein LptD [Alphaproteobacteria bacterium]|nr:LPS assembly protein LptD [Alphaproteobacteria bacterium]